MKKLFNAKSKELFRVSRSRLERFLDCPRCFYFESKEGISRPSMPGFALNSAVDALLKKEFDEYRQQGRPHPIMEEYGLKAVPFPHPDMDVWRNNFKGISYHHQPTNFLVFGAIDDVWQEEGGDLIIVDYKATSTSQPISLEDKYRQNYKKQMEVYQWIFRRSSFPVSEIGYFVYANGLKEKSAFENRLEFKTELIAHQGDDSWVESTLERAYQCLLGEHAPPAGPDCEYCLHHRNVSRAEAAELNQASEDGSI